MNGTQGTTQNYLPTIKTSEFVEYAIPMADGGLAMMVYGAPGIGKTALSLRLGMEPEMVAWSNAKSGLTLDALQVVHLSAPELNPEDLMGVPTIKDLQRRFMDGREELFRVTVWATPAMFDPTRPFILFIDEPNRCEPAVRNALFQLITGKTTSAGFALPLGSFVVMAGNRLEDRAGVRTLDNAFNGRAGHFNMVADLEAWLDWAQGQGLSPLVRAFLKRNPGQLADLFKPDDPSPQKPMPRTWEAVGRIYASPTYSQAQKRITADGLVGKSSAQLLAAFAKHEDAIPDPETLRKNPDSIKIPAPGDIDTAWVLSMALADQMVQPVQNERDSLSDPLGIGIGIVLGKLVDSHADPATYALESARRKISAEQKENKGAKPRPKVFLTVANRVGQHERFRKLFQAIVDAQ
jgi:hypothetical protein